jgi:uncharacterized coiled-coil protein SlyX
VIGDLSRLVKRAGEQQREIVLELSKELGQHNKLIEKAMEKEDRLLAKVNRIEEKMMAKEIYNYTYIQEEIRKRREMRQQQEALRTKEQGKLIFYPYLCRGEHGPRNFQPNGAGLRQRRLRQL